MRFCSQLIPIRLKKNELGTNTTMRKPVLSMFGKQFCLLRRVGVFNEHLLFRCSSKSLMILIIIFHPVDPKLNSMNPWKNLGGEEGAIRVSIDHVHVPRSTVVIDLLYINPEITILVYFPSVFRLSTRVTWNRKQNTIISRCQKKTNAC